MLQGVEEDCMNSTTLEQFRIINSASDQVSCGSKAEEFQIWNTSAPGLACAV
jgi:hypothetical protein